MARALAGTLVWQRELPQTYAGRGGKKLVDGDGCTWPEAKRYCRKLELAGKEWRLPSKIELETGRARRFGCD